LFWVRLLSHAVGQIEAVPASVLRAYGDVQVPLDHARPALPAPRGPLTDWLLSTFARPAGHCGSAPTPTDDSVTGEDSALALYLLYELHYRGLAGVDDGWEWQPDLLAVRQSLEVAFLARLRDEVPMPAVPIDVATALRERTEPDSDGEPSLAAYSEHDASLAQIREVCVHRSAWQLKEADPHSWALPRLGGRPKAALAEIQSGEYGDGVERDVHQNLYALTLSLLGLDTRYGAYVDLLPGVTLATVNLVSLFGLHRRWLPAMVGHLAAFEMSSIAPMAAYSAALRRLGLPQDACHFFDVHVVADAHHQQIAADELAAGLVEQQPDSATVVLWGADTLAWTEAKFSEHVFRAWRSGTTSLRRPLLAIDTPVEAAS
jgi:hypothetical protein